MKTTADNATKAAISGAILADFILAEMAPNNKNVQKRYIVIARFVFGCISISSLGCEIVYCVH